MTILMNTLRNLEDLFIYNNNHYKNINDNVLILYNHLHNRKLLKDNIAILSKNNTYYLDFLILSLTKSLNLHNLTNIDDPEYYKSIIKNNNIKLLIIDIDFKDLIPIECLKTIKEVFIIGLNKKKIDKLNDIEELYDTENLNKESLISLFSGNKDENKGELHLFYHTSLKSEKIIVRRDILEYQIDNISKLLLNNHKCPANIKWLHNIPLFNPISLSYILAVNNLNGYVFINTIDGYDYGKSCIEYNITHLRITQKQLYNNEKFIEDITTPTTIFCELKKSNILTENIVFNNNPNVNIVYDILLLKYVWTYFI